ncbi:hypothetical protein FRC07_007238 [Ceratobasidium sp. 392]|nr:hypothetical protein FRC07_007238 [Ceratobasidium sp. 392]
MGKKDFTILLIGETGSGKSTFLSLLLNLLMGHEMNELCDLGDLKHESKPGKPDNQTTPLPQYEITTLDGTRIRILDTPGLPDIQATDVDSQYMKAINDQVRSVDHVHAVLAVAKGTNKRLQAATDYALASISRMFPRPIAQNIGLVLTHTRDGEDSESFDSSLLPKKVQNAERWVLQNPLATFKNAQRLHEQKTGVSLEELLDSVSLDYDLAVAELNRCLGWVDKRQGLPTTVADKLYHITVAIEKWIWFVQNGFEFAKKGVDKYKEVWSDLDSGIKSRAEIIQDIKGWFPLSLQADPAPSTVCLFPGCNANCHPDCHDPGKDIGSGWSDGMCGSKFTGEARDCSNCHHDIFYHDRQKHRFKPARQQWTDELENPGSTNDDIKNLVKPEVFDRRANDWEKAPRAIWSLVRGTEGFDELSQGHKFTDYIEDAINTLEERLKQPITENSDQEMINKAIERFKQKKQVVTDALNR